MPKSIELAFGARVTTEDSYLVWDRGLDLRRERENFPRDGLLGFKNFWSAYLLTISNSGLLLHTVSQPICCKAHRIYITSWLSGVVLQVGLGPWKHWLS